MSIAYDYSAGPIAPTALKAAKVGLVMRYVSTPGNPKNITAAEYRTLAAAGIGVGLVYETSATWMLGGYSAGLAAAKAARAQASAAGYPVWQRLWFAADWDVSKAQLPSVLDALHGCADAEGSKSRVAVYGGYAACAAATAAGFAAPWQTVAWSGGRWANGVVLRQRAGTVTCGGVQVDVNDIAGPVLLPGPGQTTTAAVQGGQLEEEDDMSTQAEAGYATVTWSTGAKHVVQAAFDAVAGNQPVLRVVLLLATGPLVLADAWKPTAGARVIEFKAHQADAYGIELQPVGAPARYAVTVS